MLWHDAETHFRAEGAGQLDNSATSAERPLQRTTRMGRWLLVIACLAAGCTSDQQRQQQALEGSASWLTTTSVALEHWVAGRGTTPYTRSTLRRARENLLKLRRDLPADAARDSGTIDGALHDAMAQVESGDRAGANATSARLRASAGAYRNRTGQP